MASDNEACCINDPNFAVICGFLEKFGVLCGVIVPDFMELQEMLENTHEVPPALIDLHIKLLRKVRRSVSRDRWERVLIKICHIYCTQDAWELERFGYKKARLTSKLRILKNLCEMQFDLNQKFKAEVNRQTANELRSEPIGRDKFGHSYWYQIDENCQLRVYREDPDEETWTLVARDREGLVRLIQQLSDGDVGELVLNEDSNSLEIEKPITDTGQISSSVSTCEPEVDADADADADASSTGNEDSKESAASDLKTDVASSNESDNKIIQPEPEPEHILKENDLKITINKSNIISVKNVEVDETENNKNISTIISSNFKGTDVLSKKKKSINELAENLTKHKITDLPNKNIIQEHHHQLQEQQHQQQQQQHQQQQQQQQHQEQEMDLSMKKPVIKVKHFASLSEPPIDFEKSDEDDDDDDDDSYESDEIKLPSHMKQPRLGRPTLLGNAKKKTYSDEDDDDDDEEDDEYGEPIEEPVMLIQGEGSGRECKNENTNFNIEFSDVIEESVIYFYGEGSGRECNTGNTAKEGNDSTSSEKKDDTCKGSSLTPEEQSSRTLHCGSDSDENIISQSESVLDDSKTHKIGTVMMDVKSVDRIQVIPDVQLKKVSRWDVGKPNECAAIEKTSTNISIKNEKNVDKLLDVKIIDSQMNESSDTSATNSKDLNLPNLTSVPPKQPVFFFGPQADCFKFSSPISTHFQCTKSPSKISNTDIKDEKPENASVQKSENVPIIEKKSEILLVKEENKCLTETSTENTLDNIDDLKKEQNKTKTQLESIDSSENKSKTNVTKDQSLDLKKEHETNKNEEKNTTKVSKDSACDVKEVTSQIGSLNKKYDDDTADEKSETLSETLDSLETLIENDDTTIDVDKEKSQLPILQSNSTANVEDDKSNNKEVVADSNKYDTKPSKSDVLQNTVTNDFVKQIEEPAKSVDTSQIDETIRPVDKTQIDEISSSDNDKEDDNKDKCEKFTIEKDMVPNNDVNISVQQVKLLQETEIISLEKNDTVEQQKSTEQAPSVSVSLCEEKLTNERNIEPTTSTTIPTAENKSTLKDSVTITESTKIDDSDSSLQSPSRHDKIKTPDMLPEPIDVKNKVNLEKTSHNEKKLSTLSEKETKLNLCDKPLDIKSPENSKKEDVCLKKPEVDLKINTEQTKKSNEIDLVKANIEKVSDNLQPPEINTAQSASAIEDNKLSENKLSASSDQDAIENSTNIMDTLKTDENSVNIKNNTEQTLQISESSVDNENNSNKSVVITKTKNETLVNNETSIENILAKNSNPIPIENICEKENISEATLEHKSVENKTDSTEIDVILACTSGQNLDKPNVENRSGTEITIADKTTFELNPSANSTKRRSEITSKIENISEKHPDVKSVETTTSVSSNLCENENTVDKISILDSTIKNTKFTSETTEQISVESENKVEIKTADSNVNLLENDSKQNLLDTSKEKESDSLDKNISLTNMSVDSKNVITENESMVDQVKNDLELNKDLKNEEKYTSSKKISKHEKNNEINDNSLKIRSEQEKNDNEDNFHSIPSKSILKTQNEDEKDTVVINTNKDNKIDDSQIVIEEKSVFQKEELTNKEQLNIENEISIKHSEFSKETTKCIEEKKSESHDTSLQIKDDLPQESKDLILNDNSENKEKSSEIDKNIAHVTKSNVLCSAQISEIPIDEINKSNVQKAKSSNVSCSAQTPEILNEKNEPLVTETSNIEETDNKKVTEIMEKNILVEIIDDIKSKEASTESNVTSDIENIPKKENISIEIAKSNKEMSAVESQNSEIFCNVQSIEINKENKTDMNSVENNLETEDNSIKLPEVQTEITHEKVIPETLKNITSSNTDTIEKVDINLKIVEEPCKKETSRLSKIHDCNAIKSDIKIKADHSTDKNNSSEVVPNLESKKDIHNLKTTSICSKETSNLKETKEKDEQVDNKIETENTSNSSINQIKNKEQIFDTEKDKNELPIISKIDFEKNSIKDEVKVIPVIISTMESEKISKKDEVTITSATISRTDTKKNPIKDETAKEISVAASTIDIEKNPKKDETTKEILVAATTIDIEKNPKKDETTKEILVATTTIDIEKNPKKDETTKETPVTASTIDTEKKSKKDEAAKEIPVAVSSIDIEKDSKDEAAKEIPVAVSSIDIEKDSKDEATKEIPIVVSTIDIEKKSKKDEVAKEIPVAVSIIDVEKNPKKDEVVREAPVALSIIDLEKNPKKDEATKETSIKDFEKNPKKDEAVKETPVTSSIINLEKNPKKDKVAKETPVALSIIDVEKDSKKDEATNEAHVVKCPIDSVKPSKKDDEAKESSVVKCIIDSVKHSEKDEEPSVTLIEVSTINSAEKCEINEETKVTCIEASTIDPKKDENPKVIPVEVSKIDSAENSKKDEDLKVPPFIESIEKTPSKIFDKNEENKDIIDRANIVETDDLAEPIENEESSDDDMVHDSFEQGNQYSDNSNDEDDKSEIKNDDIKLQDISIVKKSESNIVAENIDLKNISLIKNVKSDTISDVDETICLPPSISIKPVKSLVTKTESQVDDDVKTKLLNAGITLTRVAKDKDIIDDTTADSIEMSTEEKPKLMCVDISKLKSSEESTDPIKEPCIEAPKLVEPIKIDDDDVIDVPETDPLAIPDEEIVLKKEEPPVKTLSLATFKLDDTDESIDATSALPAPIARALRNRKIALNVEPVKKSRKPKAKNSSDDEGSKNIPETPPKITKPQTARRGRGRSAGMVREVTQNTSEEINDNSTSISCGAQSETAKSDANTEKKSISNDDAEPETTKTDTNDEVPLPRPKKKIKKKSRILGLDIDPSAIIEQKSDEETPTTRSSVRQSRRIAQLKIREEAMQRKIEDIGVIDVSFKKKKKGKKDDDKEFKVDKKNKKSKATTDEDESEEEVVEESKRKHKKKRKHQDLKKLFNMENPWQSSSNDSSTQNEEEEEEEVEEELTEDEAILKSDHEFSPESDLENSSEVQPLRRARTVKKESDTEDPTDEHACQKCSKADHPEWILLCDKCDCGWHCSCLRPALLVIPEGDWFCPPCQHVALIEALKTQLTEYDKKVNRLEMEVRRKERLAYVGISLNNVLPTMKEHEPVKEKERRHHHEEHSNSNESNSSSESDESNSESSSDEDSEPIYQLRQRRQAQTYRFNDYDALINSAIQDEIEAVKGAGNQGRGKDIATIVNAEKEEAKALLEQQHHPEQQQQQQSQPELQQPQLLQQQQQLDQEHQSVEQSAVVEPQTIVAVVKEKEEHESEEESDDELRVVPKHVGKKKHRKLNALDVSSEDDNADDEDFKGTSDEEEEEFEDLPSEDSEDMEIGRRGKGRHGPIRRSTRARTQRYDRDFINDDSDAEEDSRRKKKRSIWDESESEESDKDWGRKKRSKKQRHSSATRTNKKSRKRKKRRDDSDPEADVKRSFKKSRIKYGGLSDSDDELLTRRTRGKKINYIDALGSDSDDDKQKSKRIIESEDEYVANEDDDEEPEQDETLLDDEKDESDSEDEDNPNKRTKGPKGRGKAGIHRIIKASDTTIPPVFMKKMEMESSEGISKLPSSISENIPVIAANPENLNEEEVETMMMESEEYANKQLELMAIQLAKEKQKRVLDSQSSIQMLNKPEQMMPEVKQPKKRGRKRKVDIEAAALAAANAAAGIPNHAQNIPSSIIVNAAASNQNINMTGGGVIVDEMNRISPMKHDAEILPTVVNELQTTPTKRRGRGKGKKTLEKEAAASGIDLITSITTPEHVKSVAVSGTIIPPANTAATAQIEVSSEATPNIPETSILAGKLGIAAPPQPFSQSQPTPSVITRMLQSQPISVQNFPPAAPPNQMNQKYFPGMHDPPPRNAPPPQFSPMAGGRNRVPSPYRQPSPNITIYPGMRPGPANSPHRLRGAGPPPIQQMFHSTHHAMDPSPSGGGPINISQAAREGNSPQMITPPVSSPMAKEGPPPPPYNRAQIPVNRFSPGENSPGPSIPSPIRHHMFPQTGTHMQQSSPPPRPPPPGGNFSPYHPPPPPNYHYGAYPPAPSLAAADDALPPTDYQGSPYPEPYNTTDGTIQSSEGSNSKPFDEEGSGEFGGLVSYFSSQREDDLDT